MRALWYFFPRSIIPSDVAVLITSFGRLLVSALIDILPPLCTYGVSRA